MANVDNPTAGVVVYNYKDRGGAVNISSHEVDKIYITKSLISISTNKSKSGPSGKFEITLAPTKNWISVLSVGSWIEIHMSTSVMTQSDLDSSSIKTLKMIGMIDSVRKSVSVDQVTGARISRYSISGRDWAGALESCMYIDSVVQNRDDDKLKAAIRLGFDDFFASLGKDSLEGRLSTNNLVAKIINYWGISSVNKNKELSRYAPISEFTIPSELYQKIDKKNDSRSTLASSIELIKGKLDKEDNGKNKQPYKEQVESLGFIDPSRLIGTNSVWNLISTHSNDIVNELVADLRWEPGSSKPKFAIYKRVKPFWLPKQAISLKSDSKPSEFTQEPLGDDKLISNFFYLRKTNINKESVIGLEFGDNAEDIINFIEIMPVFPSGTVPDSQNGLLAEVKPKSATFDAVSFARYGIKPMFYSSLFLATDENGKIANYYSISNWLPVLRRWFFDCHKMLNGTITMVGKKSYIGVGENIVMDSELFGDLNYVKEENGASVSFKDFKIIAHVQSISHRFSYEQNGSRSFITTINFVRGVITDRNAQKLLGIGSFGVDTKSTDISLDKKSTTGSTYLDG